MKQEATSYETTKTTHRSVRGAASDFNGAARAVVQLAVDQLAVTAAAHGFAVGGGENFFDYIYGLRAGQADYSYGGEA